MKYYKYKDHNEMYMQYNYFITRLLFLKISIYFHLFNIRIRKEIEKVKNFKL